MRLPAISAPLLLACGCAATYEAARVSGRRPSARDVHLHLTGRRVRVLVCLLALGRLQSAAAWLDNAHCLRGRPESHPQSHACTPAPRTDRAGSGRVG